MGFFSGAEQRFNCMFSLQKIIGPLSGFKKKGNKLSAYAYKQVIRNKTCFSFEHE